MLLAVYLVVILLRLTASYRAPDGQLLLKPARCEKLSEIAEKTDPSGFETLKPDEYFGLAKLSQWQSPCSNGQHNMNIRMLMTMVLQMLNAAKTLYQSHAMGIRIMLGGINASSTTATPHTTTKKRRWDDPDGVANLVQEYDPVKAQLEVEKYAPPPLDGDTPMGGTPERARIRRAAIVRKALSACRGFIREIFFPHGFAYYLRVHEFVRHGTNSPGGPFAYLTIVYRMAILQSSYLDEETNDELVKEHLANKITEPRDDGHGGEEGVTALILGGGPAGLWSSWLAFKTGFNVINVERHGREEYLRQRTIKLDSIWVEQLRWYLGKAFSDNLTAPPGEYSIIYLDEMNHTVYIDIFQLEWLLGERNKALEKRINQLKKLGAISSEVDFEAKEETELDRVLFPSGAAEEEEEEEEEGDAEGSLHYRAVLIEKDGSTSQAKFRVLINAGGANNMIRNIYHGVPVPQTYPQAFFVAVVERKTGAKILPFTPNRFHISQSSADLISYDELRKFFKADQVNAIIASYAEGGRQTRGSKVCKASQTMRKYFTLGTLFAEVPGNKYIYCMAVMSQYDGIRIAGMPPELLEAFTNELKEEMDDLGWSKKSPEGEPCYEMMNRVHNYFYANVYRTIGERHKAEHGMNPHAKNFINVSSTGEVLEGNQYLLRLGSNNLNKQLFNVVLSVLQLAADFYIVGKETAIFVVVSDGVANPHFATSTGMTTGRWGVEEVIEVFAKYYPKRRKPTREEAKEIARMLNEDALNPVKKGTLARGRPVVEAYGGYMIEDSQEQASLAMENTLKLINWLAKTDTWRADLSEADEQRKDALEKDKFDFVVGCTIDATEKEKGLCVSEEHPQFELHLPHIGGGERRIVDARVTEDGRIARRFTPNYDFRAGWDIFESVGKTAFYAAKKPTEEKPLDVY